jgi:hypothetical protein
MSAAEAFVYGIAVGVFATTWLMAWCYPPRPNEPPPSPPAAVPKLERAVWLATLDPITREPNGGALPVAIRQNTNSHARN